MADEVDLFDPVEMIDDVPQRFGNLADVLLRARILDVEDLIAAFFLEIPAERIHRRAAAHQPVEHDHRLAVHLGQVSVPFDAVQRRFALLVRAPGIAEVAAVEQPAMAREHVALDAPLVKEQFVAPELLSPHRRHWNDFRVARARLPAHQPAGQARQSRENQKNDAEDALDHNRSGVIAGGI